MNTRRSRRSPIDRLRLTWIVGLITWGLVCVPPPAFAQSEEEKEGVSNVNSDAPALFNNFVSQPSVWRPVTPFEPGVNAGGDLNFSIPVVEIPGRNGLGFTVRFNYRSGIPGKQDASWVGLGWSFNPGNITRDIEWTIKGPGADNQYQLYAVDYASETDILLQPDVYYVTTPAGSFAMTRANDVNQPSQFGDFFADAWRPWQISGRISSDGVTVDGERTIRYRDAGSEVQEDFAEFVLTAEDGTRYVFAAPTLSSHLLQIQNNHFPGVPLNTLAHYVSTWRIVAILGPDYPFDHALPALEQLPDPANPSPDTSQPGSWVRFYYTPVTSERVLSDHKTGYEISPCATPPCRLRVRQLSYLESIHTPTHWAEFDTQVRAEAPSESYPWPSQLKKLTEIRLYTRSPSNPLVRTVRLDLDDQKFDRLASGNEADGGRRMGLNGIDFFGKDGTPEPGYRFAYHAPCAPDQPCTFLRENEDEFGFYNAEPIPLDIRTGFDTDTLDARAWSLASVDLPTGGRIEVEYENDELEDAVSIPFGRYGIGLGGGENSDQLIFRNFRQGGVRVTEIRRRSNLPGSLPEITNYHYGKGRVSGIPPRYWMQKAANRAYYKPGSRGKTAVYYTWIQAQRTDGTFSRTHYVTDVSWPQNVLPNTIRPNRSVFFEAELHTTSIEGNQHVNWGIPFKTEQGRLASGGSAKSYRTSEKELLLDRRMVAIALNRFSAQTEVLIDSYVANITLAERLSETSPEEAEVRTLTRTYGYDSDPDGPQTWLRTRVEESAPGVPTRVSETTYAYQVPGYERLQDANLLAAIAREDTYEREGSSTTYHAASVTTWQRFEVDPASGFPFTPCALDDARPICIWKPDRVYRWKSRIPSSDSPSFTAWDPGDQPAANAPWQLQTRFVAYDEFGHVVKQEDAAGHATEFFYGTNANKCAQITSPNNGGFSSSFLTCIRMAHPSPEIAHLSREIEYTTDRRVATITDSNGISRTFGYDAHGRLKRVGNSEGIVEEYFYKTDDVPHITARTLRRSDTDTTHAVTMYDGLGRPVQTHLYEFIGAPSASDSIVVTATAYDDQGREERVFKPFRLAANALPSSAYLGDYAVRTQAYYDALYGPGTTPYARTEYTRDGLSRVASITPPYREGSANARTAYGLDLLEDGLYYSYVQSIDENDHLALTYQDAWGQKARERKIIDVAPDGSEPPNFTLSATIESTSSADGGYAHGPELEWDVDEEIFTVPRTLVARYVVDFDATGESAEAHLKVFRNNILTKDLVYRADDWPARYEGVLLMTNGHQYRIELHAGYDPSTSDHAEAEAGIIFVQDGIAALSYQDTHFSYDAAGNLMRVYPPNAQVQGVDPERWATAYAYNTLGQLIEKRTPDADGNRNGDPSEAGEVDYAYIYDRRGNLRYVVDPERQATGGYLFTDYDVFGRIIKTGLCTGGTPPSNPDPIQPTACSQTNVVTYQHDAYAQPLPPNTHADNVLERLAEVTFDGGYYQYFYDEEGRVIDFFVRLDDLPDGKLIQYTYDRQGNVTQMLFDEGSPDELELTYGYDAAGRLKTIQSRLGLEATRTDEAVYDYRASGQVRRLHLSEGALPPITYHYHIRDWLTRINDPADRGSNPFALGLGFEDNGNVAMMAWNTEDNLYNGTHVRYRYAYDALGRLLRADFEKEDHGSWMPLPAFSVGDPITYDANGNITRLLRNDDAGEGIVLDYEYAPGSNRLDRVTVGGIPHNYAYDANGNVKAGRTTSDVIYDQRNLPIRMNLPGGRILTFRYDADGRRIYKALTDADGTTKTLYIRGLDGGVLAVYVDNGSGSRLQHWNILSGGNVLGRIEPGGSEAN